MFASLALTEIWIGSFQKIPGVILLTKSQPCFGLCYFETIIPITIVRFFIKETMC